MHKRTDSRGAACHHWYTPTHGGDNPMLFIVLFIVAAGLVFIAVGIIPQIRVSDRLTSASLGWMSEQWLAAHRASHSV